MSLRPRKVPEDGGLTARPPPSAAPGAVPESLSAPGRAGAAGAPGGGGRGSLPRLPGRCRPARRLRGRRRREGPAAISGRARGRRGARSWGGPSPGEGRGGLSSAGAAGVPAPGGGGGWRLLKKGADAERVSPRGPRRAPSPAARCRLCGAGGVCHEVAFVRRVGLARQPRVPPRFPRPAAVLAGRAAAGICPEVESGEGALL